MLYRSLLKLSLLLVLLLAACAPDNLDIVPTVVPTAVPVIKVDVKGAVQTAGVIELPLGSRAEDAITAAGGAAENADLQQVNLAQVLRDGQQLTIPLVGETVAEATDEPEVVAADPGRATLDYLVANAPANVETSAFTWVRDTKQEPQYIERGGGELATVFYSEPGGGAMQIIFGTFPSAEVGKAYYDDLLSQSKFEDAKPNDTFPTPNAFGQGTYGSDAVFIQDALFIRVSIPAFSSTVSGNPLIGVARAALKFVDEAKTASFTS